MPEIVNMRAKWKSVNHSVNLILRYVWGFYAIYCIVMVFSMLSEPFSGPTRLLYVNFFPLYCVIVFAFCVSFVVNSFITLRGVRLNSFHVSMSFSPTWLYCLTPIFTRLIDGVSFTMSTMASLFFLILVTGLFVVLVERVEELNVTVYEIYDLLINTVKEARERCVEDG